MAYSYEIMDTRVNIDIQLEVAYSLEQRTIMLVQPGRLRAGTA